MALLKWDQSYSVGQPELDAQHRRWIEIINELHDAMTQEGKEEMSTVTVNSLKAMLAYARNHFLAEERYMRQIDFPETIPHIKSHNECYGKVLTHLQNAEDGGHLPAPSLLKFLKEWLVQHILNEDMKYRHFALYGCLP